MKLLLVSTAAIACPPPAYGGMERAVAWLTKGLRELGHEVTVACKTGSTIEGRIEGDSEQELAALAGKIINDIDVIIDFSHDKVVAQTYAGVPQLSTYQVMTVGWKRNPVFISKAQRQFCKMENAPVVYYGLDFDEYPYYNGERDNYLLYVGSLIEEKRVHWVAELGQAVGAPVKVAGPRWQPEYWPTLERIARLPGVEVLDEVGGPEKIELMQKARALVHPVGGRNWVEAGAIVVLEALALGTPVIASTNGCLGEYISDGSNGWSCVSVDEMVAAYHRLGEIKPRICRLSVQKFDYKTMAASYEDLAERVVSGASW
jgi:glycosyltransferase involved in cell wall biosynthesis